jgi:hypothetical protein
LQRLAKVTISATIESSPAFTADVLKRLLATCIGGRISAPEFRAALDGRFIAEPELPRWRRPFGLRAIAVREQFLQQWRDQLETWSR